VPTRRPAPNRDTSSNLAYKNTIQVCDITIGMCEDGLYYSLLTWTSLTARCPISNWPPTSGRTAASGTSIRPWWRVSNKKNHRFKTEMQRRIRLWRLQTDNCGERQTLDFVFSLGAQKTYLHIQLFYLINWEVRSRLICCHPCKVNNKRQKRIFFLN